MGLIDSQKKLILQKVHCTKYLKPVHGTYSLEHNKKDNNWYYCKNWNTEQYDGKAALNPDKWKHNRKYELKDKNFSGVVVKIDDILISSTLGIYEIVSNDLESCNYAPSKNNGFFITAATVFYRNGCKRIVPLDCIVEYDGFTDGTDSLYICNNLETVINSEPANKISLKDDGTIEIENDYNYINPSNGGLVNSKRFLLLNVKKRNARIHADTDDEWWNISNDEYSTIMGIMNKQMEEECGFIPNLSYGETNFDRLVNFANHPFAPELNAFSSLFSKSKPGSIETDCNDIKYIVSDGLEESLKNNPSAVGEFIKNCGIPYTSKINKIFLQGHRDFLEYLGIWYTGFRDDRDIEKIMEVDSQKLFSKAVSDTANFGTYFENDSQDDEPILQTCLCFREEPNLFYDIRYLFKLYDVKTALKLTLELIKNKSHYSTPDAMEYLIDLDYEDLLSPDIIRKIGKEGFTDYNHNLLMRIFRDAHPDPDECSENQEISYNDEEQKLVWEKSGYSFMLPEDTNRLIDIGSKMNICVGHLYRNKAASKQCIIVYAKKDDKYELCIELKQNAANNFLLVQKSAFANSAPKGELLDVFNQWCKVNEIKQA